MGILIDVCDIVERPLQILIGGFILQTVIITGATSGMGLSAVKLFSARGWRVILADLNEEKGHATVAQLNQQGLNNLFFQATDVSNPDSVKELAEIVTAKQWQINTIINNAGIFVPGELHQIAEDDWNRIMDVDVKSIYLMAKSFVPEMIKNGGGTIVNTGSISGLRGDYNMAATMPLRGPLLT